MIKTEREHCCDDLVVSNVETKMDYIKALVSCQEFASLSPAYVMAINGGKSKLVHRVQRLISSRNQSLNKLEKVIIGLVLIFAVAVTTAFSGRETEIIAVVQKERQAAQVKPEDNSNAIYNELIRDGLAKANTVLYCTLDKDAFVINGIGQPAAIHAKYAQLYLKKGQKVSYRFEKDYENKVEHVAPVRKVEPPIPPIRKPVPAQKNGARGAGSQGQVSAAAITQDPPKVATAVAPQVQASATKNDMTVDLIADELIKDKLNLSYQLDIDVLVVDGEKQPEAIHRKYSSKYLKTANQKISVRVSTN